MNDTKSGGYALACAAGRHDIDRVYALPGAQIYPLFDGFAAAGLEVLVPRHEQTAGYMAMGAAKSTGRPALMAVVPGPGLLNASAALATAMGNGSPVVCLTGQVPSSFLGRGRGHLHELPDQQSTMAGFLKGALRADTIDEAVDVVDAAFELAVSGRPGPVVVEMCWDTMASLGPVSMPPGPAGRSQAESAELDAETLQEAMALIVQAKRPMVVCGAGAQHAAEEVRALAQVLGAPVSAFRSGRGVVPEDHALGIGSVAARLLWDDCDLLIGIGSRLEMPYMRWGDMMTYSARPLAGPPLIRIDVDTAELARFSGDVNVLGDAAAVCKALCDALEGRDHQAANQEAEIAHARADSAELIASITPHAEYLSAIRAVLPRDGFLVPELCQAGFLSYTGAFPVLEPRTYVTEGYQGTLGFGFPTALGVKAANRRASVVSISGDGGFLFAAQELATAVRYGLGVVTCVFNNDAYGNVLRDQQTQFSGRVIGAELTNPDFVALGSSFGVDSCRVDSPDALASALRRMLSSTGPGLIEISVDPSQEVSPWPLIHMPDRPVR